MCLHGNLVIVKTWVNTRNNHDITRAIKYLIISNKLIFQNNKIKLNK